LTFLAGGIPGEERVLELYCTLRCVAPQHCCMNMCIQTFLLFLCFPAGGIPGEQQLLEFF
jgi:hypothetical protein